MEHTNTVVRVEDRFVVDKLIGKGSFGRVHLATDKRTNERVVLKFVSLEGTQEEREDSLNEVNVLSQLQHPNIIQLHESFFNDKGELVISMAYADGGDLHERIQAALKAGTHFSEDQILDWFVQMCLALQYMHSKRLIHRDLKSKNIFVTSGNIIKLGDFGIARVLKGTMDMAQTFVGSPFYMAPEMVQNKPYNMKSDVWALGCVVYELATLKHAFTAQHFPALVLKILKGASLLPLPLRYSQEFRDLVSSMLHQKPESRPSMNVILQTPIVKARALLHVSAISADPTCAAIGEPNEPHKKKKKILKKKKKKKKVEKGDSKNSTTTSVGEKPKKKAAAGAKGAAKGGKKKAASGHKAEAAEEVRRLAEEKARLEAEVLILQASLEAATLHAARATQPPAAPAAAPAPAPSTGTAASGGGHDTEEGEEAEEVYEDDFEELEEDGESSDEESRYAEEWDAAGGAGGADEGEVNANVQKYADAVRAQLVAAGRAGPEDDEEEGYGEAEEAASGSGTAASLPSGGGATARDPLPSARSAGGAATVTGAVAGGDSNSLSLTARVQRLRQYCIDGLGPQLFARVWEFLQERGALFREEDDELVMKIELTSIMGEERIGFWPMLEELLYFDSLLEEGILGAPLQRGDSTV
eukprot:tig00020909_g15359.t1